VSNINPRGLEPVKAAAAVADACARILRDKKSGVVLA
jgi:ethanolamine ammonia-lyase small subunit